MLKVGVIGCGRITEVRHAPEYAENPACELVGFYDFIPERAEKMAKLYGCRAYDSVDRLLQNGVEAVSVCVANRDHARVTIQALEAGCNVLCEKPMATTLEECEAMADAADRSGKLLMLGHNQRFNRTHTEARDMIARGVIGKPVAFHTMFGHGGPESWTGLANSWFFHRDQAAFGALADLGIHKTDLIHYLLGEPIVEATAFIGTLHKTYPDGELIDVDDNAFCLYRTRGGAMGEMHVSWTNYGAEDNSTRIYGTEGVLRLYDDPEYSLVLEKKGGETQRLALDEMTTNAKQTAGKRTSTGVIDEFVDCVLTGKPSRIDGREGLKAMRVIFAALRSAQTGRAERVEQ